MHTKASKNAITKIVFNSIYNLTEETECHPAMGWLAVQILTLSSLLSLLRKTLYSKLLCAKVDKNSVMVVS